jgi:hypothetical protein
MDLRQYFKKIKDIEATIESPYPLIVSLETTDGGKAGTLVEVSRLEAAKAIAENRAVLASEEQRTAYVERESARKRAIEKADMARRLQVAIVSNPEFRESQTSYERDEEPTGYSR